MPLDPTTPSFSLPPGLSSSLSSSSLNSSGSSWTGIDTHSSYLSGSLSKDRDAPPYFPSSPLPPASRFSTHPLAASEGANAKPQVPDSSGWWSKSTSTPPPFFGADRDRLDATPQAPTRSRSPSAPILPSQSTPTSARIASTTAALGSFAFDPFSSALDDIIPSGKASDTSSDAYTGGILVHHKSTPNLHGARPAHRRSNASVRFLDQESGEDDAESEQQSEESWGSGRLLGSKSLGNLQGLGRMRNVYIPSIDVRTTEEQLQSTASRFGVVKSVKIGNGDYKLLASRTHAFVMFERPEQAAEFIAWLKQRGIECEYGKEDWQTEYKAREDPNSTNLYVVGLPINVDETSIHRLFNPYGVIKSLKLLSDTEGNRRGPILVRMESRPQADRAIRGLEEELMAQLNGLTYPGALEKLQVRIADSDKNYKHNLRSKPSISNVGAGMDHVRASSHPAFPLSAAQEQELQERRFQLMQLISQIDDQLGAPVPTSYTTPRRFPASTPAVAFSSPHTPSSPPGDAAYHHRYSSSTFSDMPPTPSSASTWSSAFSYDLPVGSYPGPIGSAPGNPFESNVPSLHSSWRSSTSLNTSLSASTSTSISGGSQDPWRPSPARPSSFNNHVEVGNGLHHARSTPEFGRSSGSASTIRAAPAHTPEQNEAWARTLWPEPASR